MIFVFLLASVVMFTDAATKLLAVKQLIERGPVSVIRGVLELRLSLNDGIALGLLSGNDFAIIVLPLCVMLAGFLLLKRYRLTRYKGVAFALVIGGFMGNFIERVLRGYVIDMIFFPFMPWFVCNVADIAICAGVLMLAISLICRPGDWRDKYAEDIPDDVE